MRTVCFDNTFTPNSSVISKVFYDSDNRELFVHLHNGAKVGYRAVPPSVYELFSKASSAGNYWNTWIKDKPYYPGINGDVNLVDAGAVVSGNLAVKGGDTEFTVTVEVSGTITFTGTAKDGNEALRKVKEALDATFVGTHKVKELTQKFV